MRHLRDVANAKVQKLEEAKAAADAKREELKRAVQETEAEIEAQRRERENERKVSRPRRYVCSRAVGSPAPRYDCAGRAARVGKRTHAPPRLRTMRQVAGGRARCSATATDGRRPCNRQVTAM